MTVSSGSVLNVYQSNNSNITNQVSSDSNTGGNRIDSELGGSIITGNSTSTVEIRNITNQNIITSPTLTVTPKPNTQPTPTQASIQIIENSTSVSNSSSTQPAIGGAPVVLGLSNTSSSNTGNVLQVILGTLCITSALFITRSVFKN